MGRYGRGGAVRRTWQNATPTLSRCSRSGSTRVFPPSTLSLYTYLEHRFASIVVLTFEQMEALLGFALPARASTECDWWTGVAVGASRHSDAWVEAGRTATPNLGARTVAFERPD